MNIFEAQIILNDGRPMPEHKDLAGRTQADYGVKKWPAPQKITIAEFENGLHQRQQK